MSFLDTPVTLILLVTIVLVSVMALWVDHTLLDRLKFIPARRREAYRWVSSAFVHGSLWHLFANVFTLYFFGPALEHLLGPVEYLALYAGSMLTCGLVTYILHRGNPGYAAVGASGAIVGVLFGYCLFRPLDMLYVFGILPLPAIAFAVLFVVGSLWAMRTGRMPGIAHEGHLGGALGGVILTIILEPRAATTFLSQLGL